MKHLGKSGRGATAAVILAVLSLAVAGCTQGAEPGAAPPASQGSQPPSVQTPASQPPVGPSATAAGPSQGGETPSPTPVLTAPAPAPSGGTIKELIPSATAGPVTKVDMDKAAVLPGKVAITIVKVVAVETEATTPGEMAGPGVAMTVSIHNGSAKAISVDSVIVTLTDSKNGLGQPTTSAPYQPIAGELAAGASVEGVYVFLVPTNNRTGLTLSVEYEAGQASAHFTGDVS